MLCATAWMVLALGAVKGRAVDDLDGRSEWRDQFRPEHGEPRDRRRLSGWRARMRRHSMATSGHHLGSNGDSITFTGTVTLTGSAHRFRISVLDSLIMELALRSMAGSVTSPRTRLGQLRPDPGTERGQQRSLRRQYRIRFAITTTI
jgi:hypothetical protein